MTGDDTRGGLALGVNRATDTCDEDASDTGGTVLCMGLLLGRGKGAVERGTGDASCGAISPVSCTRIHQR